MIKKGIEKVLNKIVFYNRKIGIIAFFLIIICVIFYNGVFPVKTIYNNQLDFWILTKLQGGIIGVIVVFIIGVIAKIIYSRKNIKCPICETANRGDKRFCKECGHDFINS